MQKHLKRFWGLYCSGFAVITFVCVGVVGLFAWNYWNRDASGGQTIPNSSGGSAATGGETVMVEAVDQPEGGGTTAGMNIRLSEGQAHPQDIVPLPVATGEPLTDAEIQQILTRLPEIETDTADQVDFRLPEDVLPPPRPGQTVEETFPPEPVEVTAPEVDSGPLEVLRYGPEGEIPIAPFINVTFNQPMVPLATLEDLAEEDVPVNIDPDLPGIWRWVGTKTLTFNYDSELIDRLPMATEYR
ncbi:MAG TPA: hypothetical protein DEH22_17180, partial [Chloroflexi bacterium]|nr:hypothetical protein [Chloroflexota bacterium]